MTAETHVVIGLPPSSSGERTVHQVMTTLSVLRPVITCGGGGLGVEKSVKNLSRHTECPFPFVIVSHDSHQVHMTTSQSFHCIFLHNIH
jgi:hypothetical protein